MDLIGRLVISVAGHDKGSAFCVLAQDGEYLYLADGRQRKVQQPKRKKLKHVKLINSAAYSGSVSNKAVHSYIRSVTAIVETAND